MAESFAEQLERMECDLVAGKFGRMIELPIPHDLDRQIAAVIELYRAADPSEQPLLLCLQAQAASIFLAFAERQASLAVRTHSTAALTAAVIAIGLAAAIVDDSREGLLVMPLPWRAAALLGIDAKQLFSHCAALVPEAGAKALITWTSRAPENQTLACMGYVEAADAGGFRFQRTW